MNEKRLTSSGWPILFPVYDELWSSSVSNLVKYYTRLANDDTDFLSLAEKAKTEKEFKLIERETID